MRVLFSPKSLDAVDLYIARYKRYFLDLYSDTGLGESEKIIKENYSKEARLRHDEILTLIEKRLSPEFVHGRTLVNSLLFP